MNLENHTFDIQCMYEDNLFQPAGYLIRDSSSIVIDGKNWQWVLGLGIVGTVSMVIMALLEESMISGLRRKSKITNWVKMFTGIQKHFID